MRIAYVCMDPGVPIFGRKGCSIHVQEFLREFRRQGAETQLFAASLKGNPPAGLEGLRISEFRLEGKGDAAARERSALAANDALGDALAREGPFDLIYERYSLFSFAGMEYARTVGVPGLLEVNAPLIEEQAEHRVLMDHAGARRVAERVFGAAAVLFAVSEEVAAYLNRFPGEPGRVRVVPNGVDPGRFVRTAAARPARHETFTVGFVGSLKPWHGLPVLVEAFAALRAREANTRLLIVGDGPARAELEADLTARGMSEVAHLTGAVAPSEVPGLLASMDVAVAPYPKLSQFYFSPLKVYEYMAAGLPVVASGVGQIRHLIEDGVNGLLCSPGDSYALAVALDRLRRDPALRAQLGEAARVKVLANHTWKAVVRRVIELAGNAAPSASRGAEVAS